MADDKTKRGKPDRIRIALGQKHERQYWCRALWITLPKLKWLVKTHGPMVANVKAAMIRRIEEA